MANKKNNSSSFFFDLESDQHNSDIFKLSSIFFTKIKVEKPRTHQHNKTYYNHQLFKAKLFSKSRISTENCQKSNDQLSKFVLREGKNHVNYGGCTFYKDIQSIHKTFLTIKAKTTQNKPNSLTN